MTLVRTLWQAHRPLMILAATMAVLTVVSILGLAVDDRVIGGAPIWAKPFKFAVSFLAYGLMWAWLMSYQRRWRRFGWWLGTVITVAAFGEMLVITGQVMRGRQSHFNTLTALDTTLWSIMGATIVVLFLANLVWAVLLWRQNLGDRSVTLAIRYGVALSVIGMGLAYLMVMPTPDQRDQLAAQTPTMVGAHSVGVADGGPGLPLLGWSTEGGDLRIPHFVGMHALQLIPLAALVLIFLAPRIPVLRHEITRTRLISVLAVSYAGFVALVTWQALRGQPLIHPDSLTLAALALLLTATVASASAVLTSSTKRREAAISKKEASV
ncbi:LTA synthase family protein [Hoyosella subflava]|uniref:Uncharacterized protein n=1 Tax=Hoyosella subflava (strain DSM 45089 / JCM 17490 / NBRC 109087 / DQS3-9A1) TaxID=443218 RepID=F6EGF2_HOYSD|nr:hypothetical protein [Hoyosella subflava]AEF41005.1 hypothetical protein AS9A_2558 [Hoyosella subflava DQS3-9A1]